MGSEIIILFVPVVLLHMVYVIYRSAAPGDRLRTFSIAAAIVAVTCAIVIYNAGRSAVGILMLFTFYYLILVVPIVAIADIIKGAKRLFSKPRT